MRTRTTRLSAATIVALLLFLLGAFVADDPLAGKDSLTLRVNDAEAPAGGLAAVVIRTYSSRPLGQGQVCFRASNSIRGGGVANGNGEGPFERLERVKVFGKGKVVSAANFETTQAGQAVLIQFSSDKAGVNRNDGPLAVLYFRLRDDLRNRDSFEIQVDPAETLLFGADGEPISVETRPGTLEVRRRGSDPRVEPDGDTIRPGDRVSLGIESFEPFAITSGQVGFLYDAAIAARTPRVKMDRRHGRSKMSVDTSTPGLVLVNFEAKRGAINEVPGKFIEVRLRTSRSVPPGTTSELSFDPSLTFFADSDGNILPIKTTSKMVSFVASDRGSGTDDEDSDTDADSDDSDDSDGDTDGDSDGDTDGDSDGDTDGDSDGDTDGDSDGDTDDDSDGDTDGDSDDSDGDTDGDSDDSDDSDDNDDSGGDSGSSGS